MADEPRILCRNPDPAKKGTRIPLWKYEAISAAIAAILGPSGADGFPLKSLYAAVEKALGPDVSARVGAVGWHVMAVKFEMEAAGTIERVPGVTPQHLRVRSATGTG